MDMCFRCERSEKQVRLNDAIYENEMVKVCERCAIIEAIPVIRKPTTLQLKKAEKSESVYNRLMALSGMKKEEKKQESVLDQIRKLNEHPEFEMPEEREPFNLVNNFQWQIARARRNRGLSQRQLAWAIGESETVIKMIEKAELPEDPEKLIRKLEQFLQIKLRDLTLVEREEEERGRRARLKQASKIPYLDLTETESERIPMEPIEPVIKKSELDEENELMQISSIASGREIEIKSEVEGQEKIPARVLSFKPETIEKLTVQDLRKMKDEKERSERLTLLEEQRKRTLQAQRIVEGLEKEEQKKRELREKIAEEMKDFALGKEKPETVSAKRRMLERAVSKVAKSDKGERTPTISELMDRKKKQEKEAMIGNEIEIEQDEEFEDKIKRNI